MVPLTGRNVLFFGGITMIGQVIIELAHLCGGDKIFNTDLPNHYNILSTNEAFLLRNNTNIQGPNCQKDVYLYIDIVINRNIAKKLEKFKTITKF